MKTIICNLCHEPKTPDNFYIHAPYGEKRHRRHQCQDCIRARNRERYWIKKAQKLAA